MVNEVEIVTVLVVPFSTIFFSAITVYVPASSCLTANAPPLIITGLTTNEPVEALIAACVVVSAFLFPTKILVPSAFFPDVPSYL